MPEQELLQALRLMLKEELGSISQRLERLEEGQEEARRLCKRFAVIVR